MRFVESAFPGGYSGLMCAATLTRYGETSQRRREKAPGLVLSPSALLGPLT